MFETASIWICSCASLTQLRPILNMQCFSTGVATGAEIMLKYWCYYRASKSTTCMTFIKHMKRQNFAFIFNQSKKNPKVFFPQVFTLGLICLCLYSLLLVFHFSKCTVTMLCSCNMWSWLDLFDHRICLDSCKSFCGFAPPVVCFP